MSKKPEKDAISGAETTGHEWDGIKELNKPAPRWWLVVFVLAVIWAFGYWFFFPSWPVPGGNLRGNLGWTEHRELAKEQQEIAGLQEKYTARIHSSSLQEIKNDKDMYEFAKAGGAAAFRQNCTVCHGTGAQGGKGFPNLNDDDWLWGGTLNDIYTTIKHGVRTGFPEARTSQMPAFGRDGILTNPQIEDVAEYVQKLHEGDKAEKTPAYARGKALFATNCAVCHGKSGEGSRKVGAPKLSDDIWLYGGDKATIINTITYAPSGVMPTWGRRISDDTIKELTIYVHSLGGGE